MVGSTSLGLKLAASRRNENIRPVGTKKRLELRLRVARQLRFERAGLRLVCVRMLDFEIEIAARTERDRLRIEGLLGLVGKDEARISVDVLDRANEERSIVDGEVRPVVAVGEDVTAVVGMAPNPRMKRRGELRVADLLLVVVEVPIAVEPNLRLARATFRRGEPENSDARRVSFPHHSSHEALSTCVGATVRRCDRRGHSLRVRRRRR